MNKEKTDDLEDWFNHAPIGYFSLSKDLYISQLNPTLADWLGEEAKNMIGKSLKTIVTTGGTIYFYTHILPTLQAEGQIFEIHTDFQSPNKKVFSGFLSGRYISETDTYVFAVMRINQRKLYEEEILLAKQKAESQAIELVKLNEELTNFAYVLSHDLKSPLNNISSLITILGQDISNNTDSENQEIIFHINNSAKQIEKLIDGILIQYQQKEDEELEKVTDLVQFFDDFRNLIDSNKQFQIDYPQKIKTQVNIAQIELQQILINLVSNGIKYNNQKDVRITLDYWEDNLYHFFSVKDNGVGIKKEDHERIFTLFQTVGNTDRFGKKGTGIGLATVQKIINKNGGSITVESEENKGTKFIFSLRK